MVLPMPMVATADGELPAECAETLKQLKWSILGMIAFGIGRTACCILQHALTVDFFALVNLFISIVMGVFLLKTDEHLKGIYDCLATSLCQQCAEQGQGGIQCLAPFIIVTLLNVVIDILVKSQFMTYLPYGIFLAGSIVAQIAAVYFSYKVFKVVRVTTEMGGGMEMMGGGGYGRPGTTAAPPQHGAMEQGRAGQNAPSSGGAGFTPFQGQGNRLG
eukprot:TRINITY_DN72866_c0_g1_i1.p1 TRINITY_DN72866_c0_g1~~TRINITY_DN72866_c0_g1_i1.p1  ORF type:complete len:217 (-),score=42.42 TRINITY_DN72866_c0_g1_i1:126-776(-)